MPPELPKQLAEVLAMLELTPWHCPPINDDNPDGAVRQFTFGDAGQALLTFLILEQQRRVDVLEVLGSSERQTLPRKVERVSLWV